MALNVPLPVVRILTTAALAVVLVAAIGGFLTLPTHPSSVQVIRFDIPAGQGTRAIALALEQRGLIRSKLFFVGYTKAIGVQSELKAGTYLLSPGMSMPRIVNLLANGKGLSDDVEVTIPEGSNVWQIDALVASTSAQGQFVRRYHPQEGRLFPETYRLKKTDTIVTLGDKMLATFQERASGYTDQQIVVASILEKEAKSADDMALVAGIITKRLDVGMPLQIDATVAYGWCARTTGFLRPCDVTQAPIITEIKKDGPYNTYTRTGLPVGAISNPGLNALQAAAHPKDSPYLYYLSTRDGSKLIYAKTLQEHLKNRQKYLDL